MSWNGPLGGIGGSFLKAAVEAQTREGRGENRVSLKPSRQALPEEPLSCPVPTSSLGLPGGIINNKNTTNVYKMPTCYLIYIEAGSADIPQL